MKILKGLLSCTVGLLLVIVFCGGVSGMVEKEVSSVYAVAGTAFLLPRTAMIIVWLVMFLILAVFFGVCFLHLRGVINMLSLGLFCALHTLCPLSLFYFDIFWLGLVSLSGIIVLFIFLGLRLLKVMPYAWIIFAPYFSWLTYLFGISYMMTVLN